MCRRPSSPRISLQKVKQCKTVDRDSAITFKQQLENLCDERQDQWANEVAVRLSGLIDLHAADAQYHVHCYNIFHKVPVTLTPIMVSEEKALSSIISMMAENITSASGTLSRKQVVSNVMAHFSVKLLMFHIEGCDSVVGFNANLGKFIKIVKINKRKGDNDEIEKPVRNIQSEVMATPRPADYDLNAFTRHKVIESTSATLLKLVSSSH